MLNEEVVEILKEEKLKRGLNYEQLANLTGVTSKAIVYWIKGQRIPRDIYKIDKVLRNLNRSITLGR